MNKGGLERRRVSASRSSTMRSPVLAGFSGGFSFVRPMLEEILFPFDLRQKHSYISLIVALD